MPSVFDSSKYFTFYDVTLQFRSELMGGTPQDPKAIEGWIRTQAGITDEDEIKLLVRRTILETAGYDWNELTDDEKIAISEDVAKERAGKYAVVFKRDPEYGLVIESRQVKAMLRENVNIIFAGERWGPTRKGPKAYAVERVFVLPVTVIALHAAAPDGMRLISGHVSDAHGERATLTHYEYVWRPRIQFQVMVWKNLISDEQWEQIWIAAQENGLGALRSQGFGRYDVEQWDRAARPAAPLPELGPASLAPPDWDTPSAAAS